MNGAFEVLNLFDKHKLDKTAHTYGTIVSMLTKARKFNDALEWKDRMLACGFKPSPVVYGKLIHAAACGRDVDTVIALLDEHVDKGVETPQVCNTTTSTAPSARLLAY